MKLWANEIARKLYASLGFEETGEMDGGEIVSVSESLKQCSNFLFIGIP